MDNVSELPRPIEFTLDGRSHKTTDHHQRPAALVILAGFDPSRFDLGELKGHRPDPIRYSDDTIVEIHNKARFVSIRHRADVA